MNRSAHASAALAQAVTRLGIEFEANVKTLSRYLHAAAHQFDSGNETVCLSLLSSAADHEAHAFDSCKITESFARALGVSERWHHRDEERPS